MKTTRTINSILGAILAFSLLATATPMSAYADRDNRGRGERHDNRREWHGDIRSFHERDLPRWRSGHWTHGYHDGRLGWWWVVAGLWYFYPQRVYPYPDPYTPPVVIVPPAQPAPSAAPPAQYWYYCDAAKAYYPYVPSCPGGWRMVPATPSDTP